MRYLERVIKMDLWIRSQDKEDLIKARNIRYWGENQIAVNIWTSYNNINYVVVGEYATKERALEVLDEIQEAQLGNYHYRCPSNVKLSNNEDTIVYQMPEE